MSKKNKDKNLNRPEPQPIQSEYNLSHALNAIRKGSFLPYDSAGGTKTDVKIGSVNFNVWSNPEASSETNTQLGDKYVTEKYVESIVNNLKADQTNSSTKLIELFNGKIAAQNTIIDSLKEKSLSKSDFWTGVGIVVAFVSLIATFVVFNVQENKESVKDVSNSIEESSRKIERIENKVDSLDNVVIEISRLHDNTQMKK